MVEGVSIVLALAVLMKAAVVEERVVLLLEAVGVVRLVSRMEEVVGAQVVRFQVRVVRELGTLGVEARGQRVCERTAVA